MVTKFWRLPAKTIQWLMIRSCGAVAELSRQKASSASAAPAASSLNRWCHASSAHTAPPEVPLRPTTSCPLSSSARRSLLSTPAVKAVWLPPPWHAIATRLRLSWVSKPPPPSSPAVLLYAHALAVEKSAFTLHVL